MIIGTAHNLPYTITNAGNTNQTFTVNYTDSKGYHSSVINSVTYHLSPGKSEVAHFKITGTTEGELV